MADRKLRIGVAGLGRAFTLMLPTFTGDPRVGLVAATDPRPEARARFTADFNAPAHDSVEALCADPNVEAVYVATPHQMHAEHVCLAAHAGKHVLVEKPMAVTLADCEAMIAAAKKGGVHIIVGHSHSFNAPVLRAREMIESGKHGRVRMITTLNFTDYMYRPRRPEELDTGQGGGVIFSQGAHQIDIVRLLGGGKVRSVRAAAGMWDPARPTEGAYSALLTFEDGVFAQATYSGYAHYDSDALTDWVGELGLMKDRTRYGAARKALKKTSAAKEAALKAARNYGGDDYTPVAPELQFHQHFGFLVVSCEKADLRPAPDGVMVHADDRERLETVPVRDVPRAEVIDELYAAAIEGKPPLHSGPWAMATLEVCLAILRSAREGKEIALERQVGVRA